MGIACALAACYNSQEVLPCTVSCDTLGGGQAGNGNGKVRRGTGIAGVGTGGGGGGGAAGYIIFASPNPIGSRSSRRTRS